MDLPADLLTLEEVGSTNDVARELAASDSERGNREERRREQRHDQRSENFPAHRKIISLICLFALRAYYIMRAAF